MYKAVSSEAALFQSDSFITFIFSTGGIILKPYIIKRILSAIPLLLIISFVCFVFINLIPSDPAEVALRVRQVPIITEDAIAEVRAQLGLDKPYLVRYFTWVFDCLHGDFGISYVNPSRTVAGELLRCMPATLQLAGASLIMVILLSLPIGFLCAVYKDGWFDRIMRSLVFMTTAMPPYWVGLLLMWLIKRVLKPIMYKAGKDNQDYYSSLFKWISQTVQGIKEVKISGKEQYFVSEYRKCGKGYVDAVQRYSLYNQVPKLLIETACVATMVGYMIFLVATGVSTENMLTVFGTLAAAALVLLPCVNRINNQINSIAYFEPFFMGVSDNLQDEINGQNIDMSFATDEDEKLDVKESIEMKDITYAYPNTERLIFDHADLKIPVGASVGIVGTSGAGKSTVVDILLGLLEPSTGHIYADSVDVKEPGNYRKWLKNIGYIPQMIFMLDDTIRKNVAFGVPEDKIDEDRLWEVLKEAQLDEFIKTLPEGLETGIGERGIRLSGGQRQRIGIARALYNDPEVLILDEATSALDNDTEAAIMESINRLHGRKTLIIIAHRLQTIEKCDIVYRVEDGRAKIERGNL